MDAKQFLAEFGHIVNAPEGVKRLRKLILDIAMEGKIFSHSTINNNSNTDTISFATEYEKLKKIKGIKPRKKGALIKDAEIPFDIPETWKWFRLSDVGHEWGQKKPENLFTYIDVSSIDNKYGLVSNEVSILDASSAPSRARKVVKKNTVIYSTVRPYLLNIAVIDRDFEPEPIVSTAFAVIHPYEGLEAKFLYYYLQSSAFINYVEVQMTGMAYPAINDGKFFHGLIPIPPHEEQIRIVAKVDELMALCDKLEAQQQKRRKLQILTRTTALDALANAQSPHELKDAWFRLQGNLPLLFDMPEDVFSLKDLVLELASSGNLERNCQDDSDVWKLFNSIKDIQNKEFSNREKKELKQLIEPIQLKGNYLRVALGHIIKVVSGQHLKPSEYNEKQIGMPYITGPAEFGALYPLPTKWTEEKRAVAIVDDILLTVKGSGIGKTAICNLEKLAISRQLMAVRSLGDINREYLAICVNSAKKKFQDQKLGIAIPGIGREDVLGLEIVLPCLEEQERITVKVKQLLLLCHQLEKQLAKAQTTAKNLSQAAVASITGIQIKKDEKMKAPKTELVSKLKLKVSPNNKDQAPLSAILAKHNGELSSKALWNYSGMKIDEFYQQLKTEMARDWIVEPEKARMIEKDADNQSGAEAG